MGPYNDSFKKLGLAILIVSTFKVFIPMRKLEYYFLKLRKYYNQSKNKDKVGFNIWTQYHAWLTSSNLMGTYNWRLRLELIDDYAYLIL